MNSEKTASEDEPSGGVGEPSELSAVPGGESKAPPHGPATGDVEKAPAPEKAPQQKVASEGKPKETAASSVLPKGASGDGDPEPPLTSKAAPRQKMRPCLDGLTVELTLGILQELDFRSLGAVKRVCRRLGRIADDPSLFRRVSRVQWAPRVRDDWEPKKGLFWTDRSQLGSIQMPKRKEAAAKKFLVILGKLLESGASLVSLQTPLRDDGGDPWGRGSVVAALPALLAKHKVRLQALACSCALGTAFLELIRSQPALTSLYLHSLSAQLERDEMVKCLPSLRHLSLYFAKQEGQDGLLSKLLPQLRSFHLRTGLGYFNDLDGSPLTLKAVGRVLNVIYDEDYRVWNDAAFAVEGFRREERGRAFLSRGKPWDPWDLAKNPIPQPTDNWATVPDILDAEGERQQAQARAKHQNK